eukprot:m.105249 g.105249  ORF g.105249 m.105249 type:complete len:62 (-) comp9127_c0_seq1:2274-2459(-)
MHKKYALCKKPPLFFLLVACSSFCFLHFISSFKAACLVLFMVVSWCNIVKKVLPNKQSQNL